MSFDISHLLDQWGYQPGEVVVRKFHGRDGLEKIQLRVDLGLLQMNLKGRPDGKRPLGYPTIFQYYKVRAGQLIGSGRDMQLQAEDCARLQLEAMQFHHRSICLLQLEDYVAAARDAARNLEVFDFVHQHAESPDLAWPLEQFRPQAIMIHVRAVARQRLLGSNYAGAIETVEDGLLALRDFYTSADKAELLDQSAEIQALELWLEDLNRHRPMSQRERLELDLTEAIEQEDYERAARVRDALRHLNCRK